MNILIGIIDFHLMDRNWDIDWRMMKDMTLLPLFGPRGSAGSTSVRKNEVPEPQGDCSCFFCHLKKESFMMNPLGSRGLVGAIRQNSPMVFSEEMMWCSSRWWKSMGSMRLSRCYCPAWWRPSWGRWLGAANRTGLESFGKSFSAHGGDKKCPPSIPSPIQKWII